LTILAGIVDWPSGPDIDLRKFKINYTKELKIHLGLDLQGGTHLVYECDLSKTPPDRIDQAVTGVKKVVENRINAFGVSEPQIQIDKSGETYRIIVELPGVKDIQQAMDLIGRTAQLEFMEGVVGESIMTMAGGAAPEGGTPTPSQTIVVSQKKEDWKSVELTGDKFVRADAGFSETGEVEVNIQFNNEGQKIFEEVTKRNLQKPIAIFLDQEMLSAPTVQTTISEGKARITGIEDINAAKNLAIQLNAGALPVPVNLVEQRNIGATLGKESIIKSLFAGSVGLLVVILFIIFYYRFLGFLAGISLIIYALIVLAVFKLGVSPGILLIIAPLLILSIFIHWTFGLGAFLVYIIFLFLNLLDPVVLTLGGIAGFILSLGMVVDADVLIFERIKEELRTGKPLSAAIDSGFKRAWPSIWDSDVALWIICIILYWFGTGFIRGFALVLFIGVLISIFTAVVVNRIFLNLLIGTKLVKSKRLMGVKITE
jgi:preprotein translocase subunit SecD